MLKVQISVTHGRGLATLYGFYNIFIQDKGQSRKEAGAEGLACAPPAESKRFALCRANWTAIEKHITGSQWAQKSEPLTALQSAI